MLILEGATILERNVAKRISGYEIPLKAEGCGIVRLIFLFDLEGWIVSREYSASPYPD